MKSLAYFKLYISKTSSKLAKRGNRGIFGMRVSDFNRHALENTFHASRSQAANGKNHLEHDLFGLFVTRNGSQPFY